MRNSREAITRKTPTLQKGNYMANRRMLSREITESDSFKEMPLSSQALYLHYSMNGDDDGVVNNPRTIQKSIGASEDDLRILIAKRFIIPIDESGIIVIKHWKINNYIQKDRYTPSKYQDELRLLGLDENNAYTTNKNACIQNGYTLDTQDSIGKVSIDKNSIEKNIEEKKNDEKENDLPLLTREELDNMNLTEEQKQDYLRTGVFNFGGKDYGN